MARCKSTSWVCLLWHAGIVGCGVFIFFAIIAPTITLLVSYLGVAYVLLHALQDRFIWRWYARRVRIKGIEDPIDDEGFFTTIGIDQTLHLLVLFYFASLLI
jgi:hypothetical protein